MAATMPPRPTTPANAPTPRPPHPATVLQRRAPHPATVAQRRSPHPATIEPKAWSAQSRAVQPSRARVDEVQSITKLLPGLAGLIGEYDKEVLERVAYSNAVKPDFDVGTNYLCVLRGTRVVSLTKYSSPSVGKLAVEPQPVPAGDVALFGSAGFNPCVALCALSSTAKGEPVKGLFHWSGFSIDGEVEWAMEALQKAMQQAGAVNISYYALNPHAAWEHGFDEILERWQAATVVNVGGGSDMGAMEVYFTGDGRILYTWLAW